jgi:hypothetical protein
MITVSRSLMAIAGAALGACSPVPTPDSANPPPSQSEAPNTTSALTSATTAPVTSLVIAGCCTVRLPEGAVVAPLPAAVPVDGFAQREFTVAGETVRVVPLLGAYGWLGLEQGNDVALGGLRGRAGPLPDGGQRVVLPVRRVTDGRERQMTVSLETDCSNPSPCAVWRASIQNFRLESGWAQDPAFR